MKLIDENPNKAIITTKYVANEKKQSLMSFMMKTKIGNSIVMMI